MERDNTTTRSFRISDDVNDKIKEIAAEIGGNQQQTLSKLIETYELQKGKAILVDKKSDIETFENYINSITRMYMGSLEDNQNVSALIRTEFEAQLQSKDKTIQDLQNQLSKAEEIKQQAVTEAETLKNENGRLNEHIKSLTKEFETKNNDLQDMLNDKDNLNKVLAETIEQQKMKITAMERKTNEAEALKEELEKCKDNLSKSIKDNEKQQLQHEKDILSLEKKLQAEKIAEIDKYQNMYMTLVQEQQQNQQEKSLTKKTTTRTKKTTTPKKEKEE